MVDKVNQAKDQEIESLIKEGQYLRAKKDLVRINSGTEPIVTQAISNIFTNRTPGEIKEILNGMTPEMIHNLQLLTSSLETNQLSPVLAYLRDGNNKKDNTTELLLRLLLEKSNPPPPQQQNMGEFMTGLAALLKTVKDEKTVPPPPQQQTTALDVLKVVMEINRPLLDNLKQKDKELIDAKLKEMEAKMPGSLDEQIKYVKDMAPLLGIGQGGTNELDLRLEAMKQSRDIDFKKLEWEQKKYEMEADADTHKWDQIGKIFEGPLGDVVKNFGAAGAERVRGKSNVTSGKIPKPVQTQCPNCSSAIYVDADVDTAVCGHCGAILQKGGVPPPVPPQPTQPTPTPTSNPVPTPEQPEEPTPTEIVPAPITDGGKNLSRIAQKKSNLQVSPTQQETEESVSEEEESGLQDEQSEEPESREQ